MAKKGMRRIVVNDLATLPLSRQRKYQLRKIRAGCCMLCGREAHLGTVLCYEHHLKRGVRRPGRNKKQVLTLPPVERFEQTSLAGRELFLNG